MNHKPLEMIGFNKKKLIANFLIHNQLEKQMDIWKSDDNYGRLDFAKLHCGECFYSLKSESRCKMEAVLCCMQMTFWYVFIGTLVRIAVVPGCQ